MDCLNKLPSKLFGKIFLINIIFVLLDLTCGSSIVKKCLTYTLESSYIEGYALIGI